MLFGMVATAEEVRADFNMAVSGMTGAGILVWEKKLCDGTQRCDDRLTDWRCLSPFSKIKRGICNRLISPRPVRILSGNIAAAFIMWHLCD